MLEPHFLMDVHDRAQLGPLAALHILLHIPAMSEADLGPGLGDQVIPWQDMQASRLWLNRW